jgi:hypothetical protein
MNYWLAQLILAARNRDDDGGWMQILVFLMVAVFYVVGGIIKAATNKAAPKKQEKQMPRKPLHKPQGGKDTQMPKQQKPWHPERPKPAPVSRPQPSAVKPQVRPVSRKVVRPAASKRKRPMEFEEAIKLPTFEQQSKLGKTSELGTKITETAEISKPKTEHLSEILSDYEDSEKLRRAILHYEILGKPIALRQPSGQVSEF